MADNLNHIYEHSSLSTRYFESFLRMQSKGGRWGSGACCAGWREGRIPGSTLLSLPICLRVFRLPLKDARLRIAGNLRFGLRHFPILGVYHFRKERTCTWNKIAAWWWAARCARCGLQTMSSDRGFASILRARRFRPLCKYSAQTLPDISLES